jgi:hypothetical protein
MIYIDRLPEEIQDHDLLVVGCPKGVGFTSFMANYIANRLFFETNFKVLVLVNSEYEKSKYLQGVEDILLDEFQFDNFTYEKGKMLIGENYMQIFNAHKEEISFDSEEIFDILLIDNEQANQVYYEILDNDKNFKKVIVGTYDFSDSLYYKVDNIYSIRIYSDLSQNNIAELSYKTEVAINEDKLIRGEFSQYI